MDLNPKTKQQEVTIGHYQFGIERLHLEQLGEN